MKLTFGIGSAWAAIRDFRKGYQGLVGPMEKYDIPAEESSLLGTGSVDFLRSSRREGEIVRKSTPARALISPT